MEPVLHKWSCASRTSNGTTDVALRLEAAPQFGESFNSITVWSIEPVHLAEILVGKSVAVKIAEIQSEKSKLQKYKSIFPDVAWAKLYGWTQEFTEETMKPMLGNNG